MKKFTVCCCFLFLTIVLYAQASDNLYQKSAPAVGYITHAISLEAANARNVALVRRLEELIKQPLFGKPLPLATGSAFSFSEDGWILTARHVVDLPELRKLRASAAIEFSAAIEREYSANFSAAELRLLKNDLVSMINAGDFKSILSLAGTEYKDFKVQALVKGDESDLALLKVAAKGLPFLPLADPSSFSSSLVGDEVYAFGYPLASVLDSLFKDKAVSMTKGIISALRSDPLSVQHTAPISPGNSGGPLVNARGEVLALNSGQITAGNSLYFAVGLDRISSFLNGNGLSIDLFRRSSIQQGAMAAIKNPALPDGMSLNSLGELELSADVLVDAEPGAKVYIDGTFLGEVPIFIELKKPLSDLLVQGESGEFRAKARKLSSVQGSTLLTVPLKPSVVELTLSSEPTGAEVYKAGILLGSTPLKLRETPGLYVYSLKKDGYRFPDQSLALDTAKSSVSVSGLALIPVSVLGLENETEYQIVFGFNGGSETFENGQAIALPEGEYTVTVRGLAEYEAGSLQLSLVGQGGSVDASTLRWRPELSFFGLSPASKVYIKGVLTEIPETGKLELPFGIYDIAIAEQGLRPVITKVTLKVGQEAWVRLPQQASYGALSAKAGRAMLIGAATTISSIFLLNYFDDRADFISGIVGIGALSGVGVTLINLPRMLYYSSLDRSDEALFEKSLLEAQK